MYTIPQSPRWLALRGRTAEAKASLAARGRRRTPTRCSRSSSARPKRRGAIGAASCSSRAYRKPILLAILLAMFNQLSGINAILYYLKDIFAAAGFSELSNDLQAVAIGAANLIATMIALRVIDRVGRKKLLLIGAVGTAVALAGVAVIMGTGQGNEYLLAMLIMFIAFFAFSQGAVIWVYLAEIFPTAVRSRGQALGSATHWGMNAHHRAGVSDGRRVHAGAAVRVLRGLHGGAVLRGAGGVSRRPAAWSWRRWTRHSNRNQEQRA